MNIKLKKTLKKSLYKIRKTRILCLGDIIFDQYVFGRIDRISPEAPIPILFKEKKKINLGGAGNVARNISNLGAQVSLVTIFGTNKEKRMVKEIIAQNKSCKNIKNIQIEVPKYKVPVKTRYINKDMHLIRVDDEIERFCLTKKQQEQIIRVFEKEIDKCDIVLLSDYEKGFFSKNLIKKIVKISGEKKKSIVADPKNRDFKVYSGINIITPNQKEITLASRRKILNDKELKDFSRKIINDYNINEILVTRSEKGMMYINNESLFSFKAATKNVCDVTGAGDTVVAILALMKSIGLNSKESIYISNHAAGMVVEKPGTAILRLEELITSL